MYLNWWTKNSHAKKVTVFIFFLGIAIVVVLSFIFFKTAGSIEKTATISLTDDGFVPSEVTILKGGTIYFVNETDEDFWPASNPHPSHDVYSDFDPKQPLPPGNTWQFTFDKGGVWYFHDHLRPRFEGLVRVTDGEKLTKILSEGMEDCFKVQGSARYQCWNNFVTSEYYRGGLEQGFAAFAYLYENDEQFSEECHGYTHTLGDLAYETYSKTGNMEVTKEVAYCTYGFFHGFMESLLHDTGSYDGARDFCDEVNRSLKGQTRIVGPCIHGIGHGVTDASDPRFYGDPKLYAQEGLELCDVIGRNEREVKRCAGGVFNSLAVMYLSDDYGLTVNKKDVYGLCREYDRVAFREACYENFKIIPIAIEGSNFVAALEYPIRIPDKLHYQQIAVDLVAMMYIYQIHGHDFEYAASACNALAPEYRTHCILGLASGFSLVGVPGQEYKRAIAFCSSEHVYDNDVSECYNRMQWESIHRFSQDELDVLCPLIPEEHITYCNSRDSTAL